MSEPLPLWKERFDACLEGGDIATPEGRAALDRRLRAALSRIYPRSLRLHYEHFFRQARAEAFLAHDSPTARLAGCEPR